MTTTHPQILLPPAPISRSRDLSIGALVSLILIAGLVWSGDTARARAVQKPKAEAEDVQLMVMPRIEPDVPDVERDEQAPAPRDFAPPMQADIPRLATHDDFVQPLEPSVTPTDAKTNVITIPVNPGSGKNGFIFNPSDLDQIPVPVVQVRPQYPFEMRRAGVSGDVAVDFIVDTSGQVRNVSALSSSRREFEAAAVLAVGKWRFKPGMKNGRRVNTRMQVPIVFTLDPNE